MYEARGEKSEKSKSGRLKLVSMSEEDKELERSERGWCRLETKLCYSGQVLHGIPRLSPLYDPFTTTTCSYFDKTPGPSRCPKSLKCMGNTCRRSLSGQREIRPRNFDYGDEVAANIEPLGLLSTPSLNFLPLTLPCRLIRWHEPRTNPTGIGFVTINRLTFL